MSTSEFSKEASNRQAVGQMPGAAMCGQGIARGDLISIRSLGFTFSEALVRIKNGQKMCRIGWNGIGQYVFLWHGVDDSASHERASHLNGIRSDLFGIPAPHDRCVGRAIRMMPHFRISTGPNGPVATWVPSVTDLLAEDWTVA